MKIFDDNNNALAFPLENENELLIKFREKLLSIQNFSCPLDQAYLLRLLRYRKHNIENSASTVVIWWNERHGRPWLCENLQPSLYTRIYSKPERSCLVTLRHRDVKGRQIIMFKPGNWNTKESTFLEEFRANYSILETVTQLNGVVYIVDLENFKLQHVRGINPTCLRDLFYCCEGYPIKIANIHFVNNPFIFTSIWSIAKFMISTKIKERVHFHGYDYRELQEFIGPELLPVSLGGFLSKEDAEEKDFTNLLMEKEVFTIYKKYLKKNFLMADMEFNLNDFH